MGALAKDTWRAYAAGAPRDVMRYGVLASTKIYEGAMVMESESTGYATNLTGTGTSDGFLGIALRQADNSASAVNGAKEVDVVARGLVELEVSGASVASLQAAVYATTTGDITLTSTSAKQIGKVAQHISGEKCLVFIEGGPFRSI